MTRHRDPHGVEHEPWMTDDHQPHEHPGDEPAHHSEHTFGSEEEAAEHTVWDETSWRVAGGPPPDGAFTYAAWYRRNLARISEFETWAVAITLACIGGLGALLGVFWTSYYSGQGAYHQWLNVAVIGPVMEELLKVGAALMVLERRPFLFRRPSQLFVATLGSALMFAIIENILYIFFYLPEGSAEFIYWRWTVCTSLHVGATAVATLGLVRMWRATQPSVDGARDYSRPSVVHGAGFFAAAIVIHGVYNSAVLFAGLIGMTF